MLPINFQEANRNFGAPKSWDEEEYGECMGLPVCVTSDRRHISIWKLSWRERLSLLFGGKARLTIHGMQPVISLDVMRVPEVKVPAKSDTSQPKSA